MCDTASLELSKELWELSGWESDLTWAMTERENTLLVSSNDKNLGHDIYRYSFAYDAGYLLRKLPKEADGVFAHSTISDHKRTPTHQEYYVVWECEDGQYYENYADTPEDALCALAINLHKAGILPISGRD